MIQKLFQIFINYLDLPFKLKRLSELHEVYSLYKIPLTYLDRGNLFLLDYSLKHTGCPWRQVIPGALAVTIKTPPSKIHFSMRNNLKRSYFPPDHYSIHCPFSNFSPSILQKSVFQHRPELAYYRNLQASSNHYPTRNSMFFCFQNVKNYQFKSKIDFSILKS